MNENTLIVICGYQGDQQQVFDLADMYTHHNRPILVLSPEDAPITAFGPHTCQFGGKRAYIGQDSLDRQLIHLKMALELPFDWYLFNDADSFCIMPEIPAWLYQHEDMLFSNEVNDFRVPGETFLDHSTGIVHGPWPTDYHAGFPLIAMQPPYFMHRKVLKRLVEAGRQEACPTTPFIDWFMVQLAVAANVPHSTFMSPEGILEGASCECVTEPGMQTLIACVKRGAVMIHSVKNGCAKDRLVEAREEYLRNKPAKVYAE